MIDFAALEQRANRAVSTVLPNATATIAGVAEPVRGIYESPFAAGLQDGPGFASALPQFTLPTATVPALWEDLSIVITAGQGVGSYAIRGHRPDGSGFSMLDLERA